VSDHARTAELNALNDLAAQIQVRIEGELAQRVIEEGGLVKEELEKVLRAAMTADLAGHEPVAAWENSSEYWVLYRLSKALYARQQREKRQTAVALGLDLLAKARSSEEDQDVAAALLFYLQALLPLQPFYGEALAVEFEGSTIRLGNEIYSGLADLLRDLELMPERTEQDVILGRDQETPLHLAITYRDARGASSPQPELPVRFEFREGAGQLREVARTGEDGVARGLVTRVTSPAKAQIVAARLDLESLLAEEQRSGAIAITLANLPVPAAEFQLNVSGLVLHVAADESGLANGGSFPRIAPQLKKALADYGFTFVADEADADLLVALWAEACPGDRVASKPRIVESARVDVKVSVSEASTRRELCANEYLDIEGFGETHDEACHLAYVNAGKRARKQIVRDIVVCLQR
jgi:hypothetical protein